MNPLNPVTRTILKGVYHGIARVWEGSGSELTAGLRCPSRIEATVGAPPIRRPDGQSRMAKERTTHLPFRETGLRFLTAKSHSTMSSQITICVPFVSGIRYLKNAIDSVFAQRSANWRLLLCENCLNSGERESARSLLETYDDPRASFQTNSRHLSMGANFNRCLDLAPSDLVTILHYDDELLVDYVDKMLLAAQELPSASMIFCPARVIGSRGKPMFSPVDSVKRLLLPRQKGAIVLKGEHGLRALMRGNFIMAPTICFRKSLLANVRWSETLDMTLDLDLYSRTLLAGQTIAGITGTPRYAYRRHPGSATAIFNSNLHRFEEEVSTYDLIAELALAAGWHAAAAVARRKVIIRLHLLFAALVDFTSGRLGAARSKVAFLFALRWPRLGHFRKP